MNIAIYIEVKDQQQPDFFLPATSSLLREVPGPPPVLGPVLFVGLPCTFDLISFERVVNAF